LKETGVIEKKTLKERALLNSAYDLFVKKGINKTVISEITENAGVAKGTFYLYFTDKQDISKKLKIRLSKKIVKEACHKSLENSPEIYEEFLKGVIVYIYDYFKINRDELEILGKSLSLCLSDSEFSDKLADLVLSKFGWENDLNKDLFLLIEALNGIMYSNIMQGRIKDWEVEEIISIILKKYVQ
jgi:AcrR family transcriptional regulator